MTGVAQTVWIPSTAANGNEMRSRSARREAASESRPLQRKETNAAAATAKVLMKGIAYAASFAFARETRKELLALKEMIEDGRIRSIVDRVYSMEQVAEAHRLVESEERLGAIVIAIAS